MDKRLEQIRADFPVISGQKNLIYLFIQALKVLNQFWKIIILHSLGAEVVLMH